MGEKDLLIELGRFGRVLERSTLIMIPEQQLQHIMNMHATALSLYGTEARFGSIPEVEILRRTEITSHIHTL